MMSLLQESEKLFRTLFEASADGIILARADTQDFVLLNPRMYEMLGFHPETPKPLKLSDIHPKEDLPWVRAEFEKLARREKVLAENIPVKRLDGTIFYADINCAPLELEGRHYLMGLFRDVSERKKQEQAIREREAKLQSIFRAAPVGIGLVSYPDRILLDVNEQIGFMVGSSTEELVGKSARLLYPSDEDFQKVKQDKYAQIETSGKGTVETRWLRKDGQIIDVLLSSTPLDPENFSLGMTFTAMDISDRKRAEQEIKKLVSIIKYSNELVSLANMEGQMIFLNEAGGQMLGIDHENLESRHILEVIPDHLKTMVESELLPALINQGSWKGELQYRNLKTGTLTDVYATTFTIKEPRSGVPLFLANVSLDISHRQAVEENLIRERERFKALVELSPLGIAFINRNGLWEYVNQTFTALFGYTLKDIGSGREWFRKAFPDADQRKIIIHHWLADLDSLGPGQVRPRTFPVTCADGSIKITHFRPITLANGNQFMLLDDITEQVQAEQEKTRLEAQLRQAQKMEAIGTLAGGIAHDFNNILSAIIGYTELAKLTADDEGRGSEELDQVLNAAEKARNLVKQILTFSRKDLTEVIPLNLNQVIRQSLKLLERTLPKMIEIEVLLAPNLKMVKADPNQMGQVLLNLAANAHDAMPDGGRLVIETRNILISEEKSRQTLDILPGPYVQLTVSDTGTGMDAHTLEHLFEPFFTTKEVGKGTGLGLSTVYGIIKAQGGVVHCTSQPDRGTIFKIYLPVLEAEGVEAPSQDDSRTLVLGGAETILLVDDEAALRDVGRRILEGSGYTVITAASGEEALDLFLGLGDGLDLTVLDLGMPGMGGHKCLQRLLEHNPKAKVIIASGYSADGPVRDSLSSGALDYVPKPFRREVLLAKIRSVLDGPL